MTVSGNRPATSDHQPKVGSLHKQVVMPVIKTEGTVTYCSCEGFASAHPRVKVREDKAQRHLDRKHQGRGLWL